MVDLESVLIDIGEIGFGMIENLEIRSFYHLAFEQVVSRAMSSTSTLLLVIIVCLQG